jgi:DNA-binding response OmpR family regulator
VKILVVEDHGELRALLIEQLERSGFAVDGVATGGQALTALHLNNYDAIVLDLGLPDIDGMQVLRRLASPSGQRLPCIVLTARDALDSRVAGLNAGADDYILKPFDMSELIARLRAVLRRAGNIVEETLALYNVTYDPACMQMEVCGRVEVLPRREAMLFEELMRAAPRIAVKDRLEQCLYGNHEPSSQNAIEALVSRLRRKLQQFGADVRIETVRGVGYRLSPQAGKSGRI